MEYLVFLGVSCVVLATLVALIGYGIAAASTLAAPSLWEHPPELPEGMAWPRVSLIVPACDERETLPAAAQSLLQIDYPDLQLILVDDRSTDGTGEIIDELAARDPRVTAVHVQELPDGWLGKVHALHQGTQLATGEFLLVTDADVHFLPDTVRRAVRWMQEEQLGHLTLMPRILSPTLPLRAAISGFALCYLGAVKAWRIGREGSRSYAGVGAFGMVRRSDFDRTEGWEWLRLEVGDDVGLGMLMVRHAEVASRLGLATDHLSIRWYESLGGLIRGLEKNSFGAMAGYRLSRALAGAFLVLAIAAGPVTALAVPIPGVQALGWGALSMLVFMAFVFRAKVHQPFFATLLCPLALTFVPVALLRSARVHLRKGGVSWRGTFYELDGLRAGRRIDL